MKRLNTHNPSKTKFESPAPLKRQSQKIMSLKIGSLYLSQVIFCVSILAHSKGEDAISSHQRNLMVSFLAVGILITAACFVGVWKFVRFTTHALSFLNCFQLLIHCGLQLEIISIWNQPYNCKLVAWWSSASVFLFQILLDESRTDWRLRSISVVIIASYIIVRSISLENYAFAGLSGAALCMLSSDIVKDFQRRTKSITSFSEPQEKISILQSNNRFQIECQALQIRNLSGLDRNDSLAQSCCSSRRPPEEKTAELQNLIKFTLFDFISDGLAVFNDLDQMVFSNSSLELMFGRAEAFQAAIWRRMVQKKSLGRPIDRNPNVKPLRRDFRTFKSGVSSSPKSIPRLDYSKSIVTNDLQRLERSEQTMKSSNTDALGGQNPDSIGSIIQMFKRETLQKSPRALGARSPIKLNNEELHEEKALGTKSLYVEYSPEDEAAKTQIFHLEVNLIEKKNLLRKMSSVEGASSSTREIFLVLSFRRLREKEILELMRDFEVFRVRLLSTISHELRTPLNCSINMLEMLEGMQNEDDDYETLNLLRPSLNNCKLLLSNIDDVLDYSSMLANDFVVKPSLFSLKDVLIEAVNLITYSAKERNNVIVLEYETEIPEKLYSDPTRIKQIVVNLLLNANKYTNKGNILVRARISQAQTIKIIVKDDGTGIKTDVIKSIGILSFQKQGNLIGLGLTISNYIARLLSPLDKKGIFVRTKEGKGSQFSFYLENIREPLPKRRSTVNTGTSKTSFFQLNKDVAAQENPGSPKLNFDDTNSKFETICFKDSDIASTDLPQKLLNLAQSGEAKFLDAIAYKNTDNPNLKPGILQKRNFQEFLTVQTDLRRFLEEPLQESDKIEKLKELASSAELSPGNLNNDSPSGSASSSFEEKSQSLLKETEKNTSRSQSKYLVLTNSPLKKNATKQSFKTMGTDLLPYLVNNDSKDFAQRTSSKFIQKFSTSKTNKDELTMTKGTLANEFTLGERRESINLKTICEKQTQGESKQELCLEEVKVLLRHNPLCRCAEILIVDDNGYNLLVLRLIIESLGLRVDCANSGEEAVSCVRRLLTENLPEQNCCRAYKVIFMDLDMPVKDGIATTIEIIDLFEKHLDAKTKPSHIIACTAFSENEFGDRCKSIGMKGYICKPVNKKLVEQLLAKHLIKFV